MAGAATVTASLVLLVLAITEGSWPALLAAVLLMAAFVLVERRAVAPLVPWRVVRSRRLVAGNLLLLVAGMCVDGVLLVLALDAQGSGMSPVRFGLTTAAMTVASVVGSFAGQAVVTRAGVRSVAVAGTALLAVGSVALTTLPTVVGLVVFGAGLGAAFVSAQIAAVSGAAAGDAGLAAGIADTSFAIGGALGVAVLSTIDRHPQRARRRCGCRRSRPGRGRRGPADGAFDRQRRGVMTSRAGRARRAGPGALRPSRPAARAGRGPRDRAGRESTTTRSASSSASSTSWVTSTTARRVVAARSTAREPGVHLAPGDRVERAERLVEQQHRAAGQEGAQQREALAHAAGQLVRPRPLEPRQTERVEQRPRPRVGDRPGRCPRSGRRPAAFASARRHGSRPSRWGIHAARPGAPTDAAAVDRRRRVGVQAGEDAQQRALAAAATARRRATNSPARTCRSTSCSATTSPGPSRATVSPATSTAPRPTSSAPQSTGR